MLKKFKGPMVFVQNLGGGALSLGIFMSSYSVNNLYLLIGIRALSGMVSSA